MIESKQHDAWSAGDSYEFYMGRWSREIARVFVGWLALPQDLDWLDVGCGTGVLARDTWLHMNRSGSVVGVPSAAIPVPSGKRLPSRADANSKVDVRKTGGFTLPIERAGS